MRALVVYESMSGNTGAIAEAIADGLSARMRVDRVPVGAAPAAGAEDVALLVVGGPTHALGLSRPGTREEAAKQGAQPAGVKPIGLREWLDAAPRPAATVAAAAFDTRVDKPRVPGSAARAAARRLRRLGYRVVAPAESFFVAGTPGPLLDGELERARQWGERLAAQAATADAPALTGRRSRPPPRG